MVVALEAALSGNPGVVAIAGTGSIVYGRNARGETARAGGWGYRISDEGSGHRIGTNAVTEIMRARDAGRTTILFERIAREWNAASHDELVRKSNANPSPNFADLFPIVQKAAAARDEVALEILSRAGAELSRLALMVLDRLCQPGDSVRIGVAGGVFSHSPQVRRSFYNHLHAAWPKTSFCFKIVDPVVGALWMARRMEAGSR
jgi:N-acetylglucosamine kinase-like BadF-type ATPase